VTDDSSTVPGTRTGTTPSVIHEGLPTQLPDIDPEETADWIASFDAMLDERGRDRARYVMLRLLERARETQVGVPALRSTDYINTIPPEREPWFPGDYEVEQRIRAFLRWNAAVMVSSANRKGLEVGGHIATYQSSASLYEVGFNHFFRGKDHEGGGDQGFIQGHASPGIYARAFLEGRLTEQQLYRFRQEVQHGPGAGLSSYPHPRLMPEFWEFPTVSMGLTAINSIYQARFNRYLHNRGIKDTSQQNVYAFLGDGEMAEPESLGAIRVAAREELDNLTWVVNCNLQQLDGPVTGNGKIIQELESNFRGAGWNVIKVIWGQGWDDLLARDVDGVLVNKMNSTPDGAFQTYSVEDVSLTGGDIPEGVRTLIVAGPTTKFTDWGLLRIDQFLMKGNSLAVFVDTHTEIVPQGGNQMQQPVYLPRDTGVEKLLEHRNITSFTFADHLLGNRYSAWLLFKDLL